MSSKPVLSTNSGHAGSDAPGSGVLGSTTPRLWTPPLRALTHETTTGFDVIDFSRDVLAMPLDPWEEWLSIHAGELLPDGRPRFRTLLILVARQNGKSTWARAWQLYWAFVELHDRPDDPFIVGTSTDRGYAKKFWEKTVKVVQGNPYLGPELERVKLTISEEAIITRGGVEIGFAANNDSAGRSRTVHRALIDEVRQHRSLDCWSAVTGAMNAVPDGQIVAISNQGDDNAILLDMLRDPAIAYLETGQGDPRLGLFEWSSPPGSDPCDLEALAAANPNLGRRVDVDAVAGAAARAKRAGGEELAKFRTEVMCQRVALLDPAIDPDRWTACGTSTPVDLAAHRKRVALCLDVSLDGTHATLVAAAVLDGRAHLDVVRAWSGHDCVKQARAELPALVAKVRPRAVGWYPNGPAAALHAAMAKHRDRGWPPRGVQVEPLSGEVTAVCMGLEEQVRAGDARHPRDPMLDLHVRNAQRLRRGDGWVYQRRGSAPIDAVYAAAGAVHLARTLPAERPTLTVV